MKLWAFLRKDIRELNLQKAEEVTKTGSDAAKAVLDLAKAVNEQGGKVEVLRPYIGEISSLLDVLNSPLAQVIKDTIPFAPLAITVLKLVAESTKKEPTLEQCIMLVSQTAYLDSLRSLLKPYAQQLGQRKQKQASETIARQLKQLGEKEFSDQDTKDALLNFPNSRLAQEFNRILKARLEEAGFLKHRAASLTSRIAWNTPRYINAALAQNADTLKPLAELHRNGGREVLERYSSIDTYLAERIKPCPNEKVFAELFTFRDIYVSLKAQIIKNDGGVDKSKAPVDLEAWARTLLNDDQPKDKVLFIQGGPGRGKSVFCRMFADQVRQFEYPRWIPILIRLRDIRVLEKDFEETLKKAVDRDFAKNDPGWLTDRNIRFLFLLDGFDELLMEGRTSGGLEEFLKQVGRFQESCKENSEKGHRVLITGRTLSLQSIERQMPSNLERVEILPMNQDLQKKWFEKWQNLVGIQKAQAFQTFLQDSRCPERIRGSENEAGLAQEPLLLYLLAAMHRDEELTLEMFDGAEGAKAKILIYEQSLNWVLTKQRPEWLNWDLTELETESLRRILAEAGLCVVQTGNEWASITMIEERLRGDDGAKSLLETARTRLQDNPLRNALAAFYLQPGRGGNGSVEFAHKSFGEFLCAERLKEALEDWTRPGVKRQEFYISTEKLHWEIYDLLGQPVLTYEIVEYLRVLLFDSPAFQPVTLFERLHDFYERWCEGEFIDAPPAKNLPQEKLGQLKALLIDTGLRQVDVYTGLNVIILLLELHRYAQTTEKFKDTIVFYPSGRPREEANGYELTERLLKVVHYSDAIAESTFTRTIGMFLTSANLDSANLSRADLSRADFSRADLSRADFSRADLSRATLSRADFSRADLVRATLDRANLSSANLFRANLDSAYLSRANLSRADLSRANLSRADLDSANLSRADLDSANLSRADLDSANLSRAMLWNAILTNANLTGVDLKEITWNKETKWDGVKGLETARNVPEALKQQLGL
ncbi:pentapeptide repeat-containing protein [Cyanobacteria bacterium FACHB-502]|nr:pentapeptide repeat-containing protein [Cyanobacteria bacterium FACHB-502]